MTHHRVTIEHRRDEGKLVVCCPMCQYCTEIELASGVKRTLHQGDPSASHRGGAFEFEFELEQASGRAPPH